jgi:hypothetical protein
MTHFYTKNSKMKLGSGKEPQPFRVGQSEKRRGGVPIIRDGRGFLPQNFFLERSPKNRTLQVPAHHPFSPSGREQTKPAEDGENFTEETQNRRSDEIYGGEGDGGGLGRRNKEVARAERGGTGAILFNSCYLGPCTVELFNESLIVAFISFNFCCFLRVHIILCIKLTMLSIL